MLVATQADTADKRAPIFRTAATAVSCAFLLAAAAALFGPYLLPRVANYVFHAFASYVTERAGKPAADPYHLLAWRLRWAGCFLGLCGFTTLLLRSWLASLLRDCAIALRSACRRHQRSRLSTTRIELLALLAICAIGATIRACHLGRSIRYDEACTWILFVSRPLYLGLSLYPLPNNHLLNTLLSHVAISLFGDSTMAFRAPVFLAGCLTIPAAWLVARRFFGSAAGLIAAAFIAGLPPFIEFSVNARGYSFQWLCLLGMMYSAARLADNRDSEAAWAAFVAGAAIGTFSIPTMIVPALGLAIWLALATRSYVAVFSAAVSIALISVVFYLPALIISGPGAVIDNQYLAPIRSDYFGALAETAQHTWSRWTEGIPQIAWWMLAAGVISGLFVARRTCPRAWSMILVLWLWSFAVAWGRHIVGHPRIWIYLLLASVILASAGIASILSHRISLAAALSLGLALAMSIGLAHEKTLFFSNETGAIAETPDLVRLLDTSVRPGYRVIASRVPARTILQYEFEHRPRLEASLLDTRRSPHVIAVLAKQPLLSSDAYSNSERIRRLNAQGPASITLAAGEIELGNYGPPRLVANFPSVTVYSLDSKN